MNAETKVCQNCGINFVIEAEDFDFYKKNAVPPPTWCPECRLVRRAVFRDSTILFKRQCQAPGHSEEVISKYPLTSPVTVYDHRYWWSDEWDPMSYGQMYNFSIPFFEQFKKLFYAVPMRNLDIINSVNCDYCISAVDCKNCYLTIGGFGSEDCLYSNTPALSKKCVDAWFTIMSDTIYEALNCSKCFNVSFGYHSTECMNCTFIYDCRNCSDCFGCIGLRNKQYYIFNQPYSKAEYKKKISEINMGGYKQVIELKKQFWDMVNRLPKKYAAIRSSVNCTGHIIENAKNCHHCFRIAAGAEDCKFILSGGNNVKDSYDVFGGGVKSESLYESNVALQSQRIYFSDKIKGSADIYYSYDCYSSSNLFGCVALRNKQYCILNRQYSKEEYETIIPKLKEHMNTKPFKGIKARTYKYGEFFPIEISFKAYNISAAQNYFPLTKEEALAKGFTWHEPSREEHASTLKSKDLPDDISAVSDSIKQEIISCAHEGACKDNCTEVFRIISEELSFYKTRQLPLPRLCPNCREGERNKLILPPRLFSKTCMCGDQNSATRTYKNTATHFHEEKPCPNEFETPFPPESPDLLYCEPCYQAEIL